MGWKNDQVSEGETQKIVELAKLALAISGDFVEMGCYKGDTSLLLADILKNYNQDETNISVGNNVEKSVEKMRKTSEKHVEKLGCEKEQKRLWIYDSFEGLPKKSIQDESALGIDFKEGELFVTKREVKERFLRASLPVPVIKKAWFSNLSSEDLPGWIAFAFLDGDFYESIRDSLKLIGPKMSPDGVVVVHDYSNLALPGVKRAVDEWLVGRKIGFRVVLL